MSTLYPTSSDLDPSAVMPTGQPPSAFTSHRQYDSSARDAQADFAKRASGPSPAEDVVMDGFTPATAITPNTATGLRPRPPPSQPLRHRQLPASFWQEPNVPSMPGVPRGYPGHLPLGLPPALHLSHLQALWAASHAPHAQPHAAPFPPALAPPAGAKRDGNSGGGGGGNGSGNNGGGGSRPGSGGQVHREFLERLQSAQVRGYDLAASRFPITEFLFYNYGLKSYLDRGASAFVSGSSSSSSPSSSSCSSSSSPPLLACGEEGLCSSGALTFMGGQNAANLHHNRQLRAASGTSGHKQGESASDPMLAPLCKLPGVGAGLKARDCSRRAEAEASCSGGKNFSVAVPTLCPYLGYNCPNLHSPGLHRFWDCVFGSRAAMSPSSLPSLASLPSLSSSSSSSPSSLSSVTDVMSGPGGCHAWKAGHGRTLSAYPRRYHPFAHARLEL